MELEDWEKELRNEYGSPEVKAEPTPSAQSTPVPVQKPKVEIKPVEDKPVEIKPVEDTPKDSGTWLFLVLFLILGITIVWIYDDKTGGKIKSSIMSTFHSKENVKPEEKELISDAEVGKLKNELEKFRSENKTAIEAIEAMTPFGSLFPKKMLNRKPNSGRAGINQAKFSIYDCVSVVITISSFSTH
jgi:hypothetical protein